MSSSREIAVVGNGGFGTALARHAHALGHGVRLWGHDAEYTAEIARVRENARYLPGFALDPAIRVGSDASLLEGVDIVLSVVPTQHVRSVWTALGAGRDVDVPIVSCSKGMEQSSGLLPTQVLCDVMPEARAFVLTGPCHAEELASGKPATVVLAGADIASVERVQQDLAGPTFRIYRTADFLGAELAGALKNIIAIAAGMSDGLGLGDNAKSALLTRGLVEMARFGEALGARRETFYGLAGVGDLITTAVSPHGRNRAFGERIGRGETAEEILASTRMVVEGVWTCRAVLAKARELSVPMPITEQVAKILFEQQRPEGAVRELMTRMLREEG